MASASANGSITLEQFAGSVLNSILLLSKHSRKLIGQAELSDDDLNPDHALGSRVVGGIDTAEELLSNREPGFDATRVDLTKEFAAKLARSAVDPDLAAHLWRIWPFRGKIRAQGADHQHTVFMALLGMLQDIEEHLRAGKKKARAITSGTVHSTLSGSPASSTAAALLIVCAILLQKLLNENERGEDPTVTGIALMTGPFDGADNDRQVLRRLTCYGVLKSIEALTLAVAKSWPNALEVPAIGKLTRPPYSEVWLIFDELCHAKTMLQMSAAGRFIHLLQVDRQRGVGKALDADLVRGSNTVHFPPHTVNGQRRARLFAIPRAQKVTLDRRALARRAAQWAKVSFFDCLLYGEGNAPLPLSERYVREMNSEILFPDGVAYEPSVGDLQWSAPLPPSPEALADLREIAQQIGDRKIARWDKDRKAADCSALDAWFFELLAARLLEGNLHTLPAEFKAFAEVIANDVEDIRADVSGAIERSTRHFDAVLAGPQNRGRIYSLLLPFIILGLPAQLRGGALAYSLTTFKAHRASTMASRLDEHRKRSEQRAGNFARTLIAEIAFQLSPHGAYRKDARSGWKRLRHPAPNITRLFMTEEDFATLYYEAKVLDEWLPSDKPAIIKEAFEEAIIALMPAIDAALAKGKAGLFDLAAATEAYFQSIFAEKWSTLHLSTMPESILAPAIETAAGRIDPCQFVELADGNKGSVNYYLELPADDPDVEYLRTLVEAHSPKSFKVEHAVREHESAIILFGLASGLTLEDIVPLRDDSETRRQFLEHERAFHDATHPRHDDAVPLFPSRYFEELAAQNDAELAKILGLPSPTPHRGRSKSYDNARGKRGGKQSFPNPRKRPSTPRQPDGDGGKSEKDTAA